jgi:hypothetical protein
MAQKKKGTTTTSTATTHHMAPLKLLWRDDERKGCISRIANPEASFRQRKRQRSARSTPVHALPRALRPRLKSLNTDEVESRAECEARCSSAGAPSLRRAEELFTNAAPGTAYRAYFPSTGFVTFVPPQVGPWMVNWLDRLRLVKLSSHSSSLGVSPCS